MSLQVIHDKCEFNPRSAVIVVQGETMDEAKSTKARELAIATGSETLGKCGIGGGESAYPVDANGNSSDELMMGQGIVAGYRCDYKVNSGT